MLYDIVVIGGGINGCGCAADAALRGLSVLLCEQDDIAQHTSSQSSKLIHGGLRYLEHYQFHLVQQALREQQILLNNAPHLIHPLAFVLPYRPQLRPAWLLRLGLFLYDHLSLSNSLPNSQALSKIKDSHYFQALRADIETAFLFYDAQTNDARLTLSVALQAQKFGATILPHTQCIQAQVQNGLWQITLRKQDGKSIQVQAKVLINAAGPWISKIADICHNPMQQQVSYVKGSHIIVPAFYSGQHAYLLQAPDKRVIFVTPYHGQTMIGTTDILVSNLQTPPTITPGEIQYFKDIIHSYFQHSITEISATWSGIRTLPGHSQKSPSEFSRDFSFEWSTEPLPMLTIVSGKLTTYRRLATQVIDKLTAIFPNLPRSKTENTFLPGGEWSDGTYAEYEQYAKTKYSWLELPILQHYLDSYGTRTDELLQNCTQPSDLGRSFGAILRQKEVDFLRQTEWAQSSEDILWRRTKLGLGISEGERMDLEAYLQGE
ncbi:MAG: glycerol-3-phosphate dehydrogenase [Gammaproteobacteria bacterium]